MAVGFALSAAVELLLLRVLPPGLAQGKGAATAHGAAAAVQVETALPLACMLRRELVSCVTMEFLAQGAEEAP